MVEKTRVKRRTPINGKRNVLNMTGGDTVNFEYRVVNDSGDRAKQLEAQGYEFVTDSSITIGERRIANPTKEGSPIKVSVGGGMQAYLMRIPKEYYEEDKASKAANVNKTEEAMKKEAKAQSDYGKLEVSRPG